MIISIAAGKTIDWFLEHAGENVKIARTVVNTPALVKMMAGAYSMGPNTSKKDQQIVETFMQSIGLSFQLPENLLDSATALAGSGPAYVYMFIEALADGGVKQGIPRPIALQLATQTVLGAAKMVKDTQIHPAILKDNVASPGGTTIYGIDALEKNGFRNATICAVAAATERAKQLGQVTQPKRQI